MRRAGLRLQIVLAATGLMTLAFVPLFFAMASLTRVTLHGAQVDSARARGRAEASRVAEMKAPDHDALEKIRSASGAEGVCVFEEVAVTCATKFGEVINAPARPWSEKTIEHRASIDVQIPRENRVIVVRIGTSDDADRAAPLIRLFAVYMTAFAVALAFLVYVALTRLIVKPVEALVRATDRVATGARKLDVPAAGARELAELSESVSSMAARLIADEESLRKKIDELTEASRRLTDAQTQVIRSERLASVGRLAAGMAHEIGNPITAILGLQDLMLAGDVPPEEQTDYVARMHKETERVNRILRDLLDFARPDVGAGESGRVSAAVASVGQVMRDVESLLKPQKRFRDVVLAIEVEEDLEVRIPPERLTQVLLNLALNAGDALEEAEIVNRRVVMRARRIERNARLEIEDNGPGVAPSMRPRLFLPFETSKEVGRGTGLGLAVCRGIVEGAGGRVDLDVEYTNGARFVITLPLVPS